jgi:Tol biopolymer transport system component
LAYLSRDGQKLLYNLVGANHHRLYSKDLKTGKEQEIPREGTWMNNVVLSPDLTRLVFTNDTGSLGSLYEVPIGGGFPKKIWEGLHAYDWSPDGATLLFCSRPAIEELDLKSASETTLVDDPEYGIWNGHFSPDGRWVTFNGVNGARSRIFVVPFRKGLVPRSEWILIADSGWDDKPHFSSNGKLIFFSSDRDGFRCLWAQPVGPGMHPTGAPFAVYHSHERQRSLRNIDILTFDIAVGPNMVVFDQEERTGNIWLLQPAKWDAH